MILWNYIKKEMLKNPHQIVCENRAEMSYENLVDFAEMFSEKLKDYKACAIMCRSEMAAAMALLACFAADVTAIPLSPRYGHRHCEKILETIDPPVVISDADGGLRITKTYSRYSSPKEKPALIMCTSGTTGRPKGAMLGEEAIMTNVKDISAYFNIGSKDSILIARPLYHCAVLTGEFLLSLVKGVKIRFYSEEFNPKVIMNTIIENKITVYCGTPTQFCLLAGFNHKYSGCILKAICVSGECLGTETAMKISGSFPHMDIYHVYGLTEASPRVSYLPPEKFSQYADCVGIPLNSINIKIVKSDGTSARRGEEGILWISGDNVMFGYYNAPKETEKVLNDGWLCTGDIAIMTEEGFLKIKGRSDDLIIRAGMNIYPAEIESELKKDIRVREVLVHRVDTTYMGVQIGLKIAGDFRSIEEVRELCAKALPKFQIPTVIEIVDELPKSISGKIIRKG